MNLINELLELTEGYPQLVGVYKDINHEQHRLFNTGPFAYTLDARGTLKAPGGKGPKKWNGKSLDEVKAELKKLGYVSMRTFTEGKMSEIDLALSDLGLGREQKEAVMIAAEAKTPAEFYALLKRSQPYRKGLSSTHSDRIWKAIHD